MLVLTRKIGETIIISPPGQPDIKFTIMSIRQGRIRIAFDAPKEIIIMREEANDKSN
jgi:carbon storage regulator CsrA